MTIQATIVVARFHLHDVGAELSLCGSMPVVVPTVMVEVLLHSEHNITQQNIMEYDITE